MNLMKLLSLYKNNFRQRVNFFLAVRDDKTISSHSMPNRRWN